MKVKLPTQVAVWFGLLLSADLGWDVTIGINGPAGPLTDERILRRPVAIQREWKRYLEQSGSQAQADRDFFRKEVQPGGDLPSPPWPFTGKA